MVLTEAINSASLYNTPSEAIGDEHIGTSLETPLRPDAFLINDEEKIKNIASISGK